MKSLEQFLKAYDDDNNEWYRRSSGELQEYFDEIRKENERLKAMRGKTFDSLVANYLLIDFLKKRIEKLKRDNDE